MWYISRTVSRNMQKCKTSSQQRATVSMEGPLHNKKKKCSLYLWYVSMSWSKAIIGFRISYGLGVNEWIRD